MDLAVIIIAATSPIPSQRKQSIANKHGAIAIDGSCCGILLFLWVVSINIGIIGHVVAAVAAAAAATTTATTVTDSVTIRHYSILMQSTVKNGWMNGWVNG